jgi:hypothetical protein
MEATPAPRFGPFSFLFGFGFGVFIGVALALAAVVLTNDELEPAPLVFISATQTPAPSIEVTGTPEPRPRATVALDVRLGPGNGFAIIGLLNRGESVEIVGRDDDAEWIAIRFPPGSTARGWVPVSSLEGVTGLDVLAVVLPTPLPRTIATPVPFTGGATNGGPQSFITGTPASVPQPTVTPTPGPPDLVVTRLHVLPDSRVAVTIANRGFSELSGQPILVQVRNQGTRSELITIPPITLRVGATFTVETESFRIFGEEEVQATVDPFGAIAEVDNNNNMLQILLARPVTPTPRPTPERLED